MRVQRAPLARLQPAAPPAGRERPSAQQPAPDNGPVAAPVMLEAEIDVTHLRAPSTAVTAHVVAVLVDVLRRSDLLDDAAALTLCRPSGQGMVGASIGPAVGQSAHAIALHWARDFTVPPEPTGGDLTVVELPGGGLRGAGGWGMAGSFVVTLGVATAQLLPVGGEPGTGMGLARRLVLPLAMFVADPMLGARSAMTLVTLVDEVKRSAAR